MALAEGSRLSGEHVATQRRSADAADEAVATVAHELRTPVAALMMTISMLVADFDDLNREQTSSLLRRMERSTIWLHGLIENLVSTAALDAGNVRLRHEVVSVKECVDQVLPIVQALLERKDQQLRVSSRAATTLLSADPYRVGQILTNLLVNASRYSTAGDVIEVDVSTSAGWAELRVVDHGPGVSASERGRIFTRHVRGSQAGGTGLGLGLSIVRSLAELHGGTIGLDDTPDGGASFWVTLPLADPCVVHQADQPPTWDVRRAVLWQPAIA
jgi:signal transduction histidine kinase